MDSSLPPIHQATKPEIIYGGLLQDAIMSGELDNIAYQLAGGISPDHRSPQFGDAVAVAVESRQLGALKILLEAGARPNATNADDFSAMSLAANLGRVDMAQMLFDHGASLEASSTNEFYFPAFAAVHAGRSSMLGWLFGQGAQVDVVDHNGRTPLLIAAKLGHADCARVCLAFGANIDAQDDLNGSTAAMFATHSTADTMLALCEQGFDLSRQTHEGDTIVEFVASRPSAPGSLIFSAWRLSLLETEALSAHTAPALSPTARLVRL